MGGGKIDSVEVEKGKTISLPTPTKENYIFECWLLNGEKFTDKTPVTGNITLKASWKWNGVEVDSEAKLREAVSKDNAKILLTNDISVTETIKISQNVLVDLNNHSITGNNVRALQFATGTSEITGEGSIKVIGTTIASGSSVIRVGDGSDWENPSITVAKLTIGENVTVETDACYAISVFGSLTKEEIIVKGKLTGKAGLGTSGNENQAEYSPVVTLAPTAEIKALEGYALYLPAAGSYTIDGTIEGPGAICTKAGNLTVAIGEGAIIKATGIAGMEHEGGYSNGPATKNYAVMVENNSAYGGPASVVINGGTIIGAIGIYNDETKVPSKEQQGTITINGGSFTDLASAINYASSGATIKLAADASGMGIGSKDGTTTRESLTIDFNGHTYTMNDPAVGSTGTETQAMHWGASLGSVTLTNGTFKIAENTQNVKMAMQNYINFTAEGMTFDFTSIPVKNYGTEGNFDPVNGKYKEYSGLEVPMFNNNSGKMILKNTTIYMPSTSTKGISADGDGVDIIKCTINGYINLQEADSCLRIKDSDMTGVVPYFGNGSVVTASTDEEGFTVYQLQAGSQGN